MMGNVSTLHVKDGYDPSVITDFSRPFYKNWDPRFITILLVSLCFEILAVLYLAGRPVPDVSEQEIARIQERFANFILGESASQESETVPGLGQTDTAGAGDESSDAGAESATEEDDAGSDTDEGAGEGSGEGARLSAAEARRAAREAVTREVSNRGLLGLLTGTGTAAEGQAVSSMFDAASGTQGVGGDLDRVLSSVNGLKAEGASGIGAGNGGSPGVRGKRTGGKASIDDLVSDIGTASSQGLERRGELTLESPEEVVGTGRRSILRSPEAIQEVLLNHVTAVRYCYERELKRSPNLRGKISVRITVSPDGSVKNAAIVTSTLNNDRVERCILARIRLWKDFPPIDPSDGDVTFRQVYTFGT